MAKAAAGFEAWAAVATTSAAGNGCLVWARKLIMPLASFFTAAGSFETMNCPIMPPSSWFDIWQWNMNGSVSLA